jgi:hypothetical protein
MKKTLVVAAAAFALAAPAFAQQSSTMPAKPEKHADAFAQIDTDKNGALSLTEIKMVDVSVTQADFDKYDADKTASINKAEFDKWQAAAKAAKPGSPG